jgi:glutaredoxin
LDVPSAFAVRNRKPMNEEQVANELPRCRSRRGQLRDALALVFLCALGPGVGAQKLYKSVAPDGQIVYSDRPPVEGRVEKTMKFENLPASALPASAATYVEQLQRLRDGAAAKPPMTGVVLFSAIWCGYCTRAKAYLAAKAIGFHEVDIDTKDGMANFAQAGGAGGGVPFLLVGGQSLRGFSAGAYDAFFAGRK